MAKQVVKQHPRKRGTEDTPDTAYCDPAVRAAKLAMARKEGK